MSLDLFLLAYDDALAEDALSLSPEKNVARHRIPSLRRWLFWLGYLKQSKELVELDAPLLAAINRFQDEAGYARNSNLDTCWTQVRQFVRVEREDEDLDWLKAQAEAKSPALSRAIFLRLHMLGIIDPPPAVRINEKDLARGLNNFCVAAYCLGLTLKLENLFEVYQAILGQEGLLDQLKSFDGKDGLKLSSSWDDRESKAARDLALTLVDGCARVELWLAGYNTGIQGRGGARSGIPNTPTLPTALQQFWKDQPEGVRPLGYKTQKRPQATFFLRIAQLAQVPQQDSGFVFEDDAEIVEQLNDSQFRSEVRRSYRSIVDVIFDGARRAINWIWNLFKRASNSVLQKARNLARLLKRKALALADTVATAVRAVVSSLKYLFRSELPGSDPEHVVVRHLIDFDFDLYYNETADSGKVARISRILTLSSSVLDHSIRFLSLLGRILSTLLRGVRSPIGWLGAIFAISRLKSLYDDSLSLREGSILLAANYRELEEAVASV